MTRKMFTTEFKGDSDLLDELKRLRAERDAQSDKALHTASILAQPFGVPIRKALEGGVLTYNEDGCVRGAYADPRGDLRWRTWPHGGVEFQACRPLSVLSPVLSGFEGHVIAVKAKVRFFSGKHGVEYTVERGATQSHESVVRPCDLRVVARALRIFVTAEQLDAADVLFMGEKGHRHQKSFRGIL